MPPTENAHTRAPTSSAEFSGPLLNPSPIHRLVVKLTEVMASVERIPKLGRNEHFRYDFVREADLVDAVRQELAKRRVLITCRVDDVERTVTTTAKGAENIRTVVHLTFTFRDGDSGETLEIPFVNEALDGQDKGINKAITAAKKYFLLTNFLVATGDDTERDDEPRGPRQAVKPEAVEDLRHLGNQDPAQTSTSAPTPAVTRPGPPASAPAASHPGTSSARCAKCDKAIDQDVAQYSLRYWKAHLCRDCQRVVKRPGAA